eukprot:Nitzschia sp. Nitz4//scaffold229_size32011//14677//16995//NITZ4_007918-RA/size32011-processed-gene-0.14-mRNA-1//-1//CDS//3329542856//8109//frame0
MTSLEIEEIEEIESLVDERKEDGNKPRENTRMKSLLTFTGFVGLVYLWFNINDFVNPPSTIVISPQSHSTQQYVYRKRARNLWQNEYDAMVEEWGTWSLKAKRRAQSESLYAAYPNRDVPRVDFPSESWQTDSEYLEEFLPEAIALVTRAQGAILKEYGQATAKMFEIFKYDSADGVTEKGSTQGGWTTHSSWKGLKRRLLHSIMTEDAFVFAMGGHSAAAGHGNHFQQSYTLQVQWILEPIFARLGASMVARNFGNGGLGTIHNGLAAGDIYGPDVDMLMWDSAMTENNNRAIEMLHRQGLLGGTKVPILWTKSEKIARELSTAANVDVGVPGDGKYAVTKVTTLDELMAQPWASRYLKCGDEVKRLCKDHEYDGVCWIDRPDFTPTNIQDKHPSGRESWHPGNMHHQLFGRVITYTILEALREALQEWKSIPKYAIPDSMWHVKDHYLGIRERLALVNMQDYHCMNWKDFGLEFACSLPMKARTEFTPRAFPLHTSIRSLMPPSMREAINNAPENVYNPPDIFNPSLHPPEGEVDVLNIVESGSDFEPAPFATWALMHYKTPTFSKPPSVPIGKGIHLSTMAGDDFCDGSLHSWCSRGAKDSCLLRAHNDNRGGLRFDSLSGWMVMNIPDLKYGYIVIKLETWHPSEQVSETEGWTSINGDDADGSRRLVEANSTVSDPESMLRSRKLKKKPPAFCDQLRFEYSIDGKVTSLDVHEFQSQKQDLARVVESLVLMKDPDYTGGVEQEVEVAIRLVGCARRNTFQLTHIYWA